MAFSLWLVCTLPRVRSCYLNHLLLVCGLCAALIPDHALPLACEYSRLCVQVRSVDTERKWSVEAWGYLSETISRNTLKLLHSVYFVLLNTKPIAWFSFLNARALVEIQWSAWSMFDGAKQQFMNHLFLWCKSPCCHPYRLTWQRLTKYRVVLLLVR